MQDQVLDEAKRQLAVCNACRYCEGFCSAFKAMTRYRAFDTETVIHMSNLCHNCRRVITVANTRCPTSSS